MSAATWALDLGLVVPIAVTARIVLLRRTAAGHLHTVLILNATIGASLMAQATARFVVGVPVPTGVLVGMSVPFAALTLVAAGLLVALFRWEREPVH